jgi:predicted nucleotidyltransferase component of viral defense system
MFPKEFLNKDVREAAFRYTSQRLGVIPSIVEKDFWVSEILEFLFTDSWFKDSFLFKGGTCLSKCFNLINRFSEDIDISIDWNMFSFSKSPDLFSKLSNTKRKKFNDDARSETGEFITGPFLQELKSGLSKKWGFEPTIEPDSDNRMTLVFSYPRSFISKSIKADVVIEMGSLSATGPSMLRTIEPMVATDFPHLFPSPSFMVRCMDPRRTFWEKLTIIYQEARRPADKAMPAHYSRHFYDVFQLKNSIYYEDAINSKDILADVIKMKQTFYPNNWMDYSDALKEMPLSLSKERVKELAQDYRIMSEMIYGPVPPLTDILEAVGQIEERLKTILPV